MLVGATYCGAPPVPGDLIERFNVDPVLIVALAAVALLHLRANHDEGRPISATTAGWAIAAAAFVSPLCALSVSLFAARVAQHMILVLVAAPLIAGSMPRWRMRGTPASLWGATGGFLLALWFWHMPAPYEATFRSTAIYWAMHLTLFGSGIWLWSELVGHARDRTPAVLAAGMATSIQMGLLGAVITLSSWPMYRPHLATTEAWGYTPLADQQLGGVLMWVPGCLFFLWAAMRSFGLLWSRLDEASV